MAPVPARSSEIVPSFYRLSLTLEMPHEEDLFQAGAGQEGQALANHREWCFRPFPGLNLFTPIDQIYPDRVGRLDPFQSLIFSRR